ncbi:uncharacterized protein LOC107986768 [Homo sapiens]|uniref:uncharacterized protein LOC107986768 n=1 Tax=Homo sapiens TaxID=9606 RepID=UPI001FB05ED3|nr:uncharacterized protein LOC107986768 [Homo sapiens]
MGASQSTPPKTTPLGCLLRNRKALGLRSGIRSKRLIFYCNTAWPQYQLDNGSQWPENGTFDFNILRDLDNFCHRNEKWSEIPYIQAFFILRNHPSLCHSCSTFQILLTSSKPDSSPVTPPTDPADDSSSFDPVDFLPPRQHHDPPPEHHDPPPYVPAPALPLSPTLSNQPTSDSESSLPPPLTRSRAQCAQQPAPLLPLREVAGVEGIVHVHVPFSFYDLLQIEERLGSFSSDPDTYIKEFKYLTQSYELTWHDLYFILSSTLLPEEKERVWLAAQAYADDLHQQDPTKPVGAAAVPWEEPSWEYQPTDPGQVYCSHMITCLIAGLNKAAHRL